MLQRILSALVVSLLILSLGGCQRRTPEDRLTKAFELYQKGDTLGAMLEARELVKKYPSDPTALDARMLLAQLYMQDRRPDEASEELQKILSELPPRDPRAIRALGFYLQVMQQQKRYDQALQTIDQLQKKYANDQATSSQMAVWRANVLMGKGETTSSRALLMPFLETTTSPEELRGYREMIARTYMMEGNDTATLELYQKAFDQAKDPAEKLDTIGRIAVVYAQRENYEQVRKWLEEATRIYDAAVKEELDANRQKALAFRLASIYDGLGNLVGAQDLYKALLAGNPDKQAAQKIWEVLLEVMVREGKVDEAIAYLRESAPRFPEMPLMAQAEQMKEMKTKNVFQTQMPPDTSTLVLKFAKEPLLPKQMPAAAEAKTSATAEAKTSATAEAATSGSEQTQPQTPPTSASEGLTSATQPAEAATSPSK